MKLFLVTILVGGAFFGGYHLGHKDGSPDITGWVQDAYPRIVQAGSDVIAAVSADAKTAEAKAADAKSTDVAKPPAAGQVDLVRAASEAVKRQVQIHPEWDPRYWNAQAPQVRQP